MIPASKKYKEQSKEKKRQSWKKHLFALTIAVSVVHLIGTFYIGGIPNVIAFVVSFFVALNIQKFIETASLTIQAKKYTKIAVAVGVLLLCVTVRAYVEYEQPSYSPEYFSKLTEECPDLADCISRKGQ